MIRWLKFNAVGMMGACVQLAALAMATRLGLNYLAATALAVEAALAHNYFWHSRWTWPDRPGSWWRFQLSNGLVSLGSNLILMRIFAGWAGLPVAPANLLAMVSTSLLNYWLGTRWAFSPERLPHGVHRTL